MAKHKVTADELDNAATCTLNRMDEKGESIEAAVEAVTGDGKSKLAALVIRHLQGSSAFSK